MTVALARAFLPAFICASAIAVSATAASASGTVRPPFLDRPDLPGSPVPDTSAWRCGILEVEPGLVIIAAGEADGLHKGERLKVVRPGMRIQPRENLVLQLPPDDVARLVVLTPFRTPRGLEGTACAILEGDSIALSDRVEKEDGI